MNVLLGILFIGHRAQIIIHQKKPDQEISRNYLHKVVVRANRHDHLFEGLAGLDIGAGGEESADLVGRIVDLVLERSELV